jgi:hypothetical protein
MCAGFEQDIMQTSILIATLLSSSLTSSNGLVVGGRSGRLLASDQKEADYPEQAYDSAVAPQADEYSSTHHKAPTKATKKDMKKKDKKMDKGKKDVKYDPAVLHEHQPYCPGISACSVAWPGGIAWSGHRRSDLRELRRTACGQ